MAFDLHACRIPAKRAVVTGEGYKKAKLETDSRGSTGSAGRPTRSGPQQTRPEGVEPSTSGSEETYRGPPITGISVEIQARPANLGTSGRTDPRVSPSVQYQHSVPPPFVGGRNLPGLTKRTAKARLTGPPVVNREQRFRRA